MENNNRNWWSSIRLETPIKYKSSELTATEITCNLFDRVMKATNKKQTPERVSIFLNDEKNWRISLERINFRYSNYSICISSNFPPYEIRFADLLIDEKRSIKTRIESIKFFVYDLENGEYILRETETYNGKNGVEL